MVNEFVSKLVEFGLVTKDNVNRSYFSMVKTLINSNMHFSREELGRTGTLRNIFEHNNKVNKESVSALLMYEMMVATACGQKSIGTSLKEYYNKQKLASDLKDVGRGEKLTKEALKKFVEMAHHEAISWMNFTDYIALATYMSRIHSAVSPEESVAFPSENVHNTSYFNFAEYIKTIQPDGVDFERIMSLTQTPQRA